MTAPRNSASGYDVFISYARQDDADGWVRALKAAIVADSRRVEGRAFQVFLDVSDIRSMEEWQARTLAALRSSTVLLVCLSPNYFASEPCRWEWQEHAAREVRLRTAARGEVIAPVYLVDVAESDPARREWRSAVLAHQALDLRRWYKEGVSSLEREEVRDRVSAFGDSLWQRLDRARQLEQDLGNLPRANPYFVGRATQLAELNRAVRAPSTIGVISAVHGLGGLGKTELSIHYAHSYRDLYGGGVWLLRAEGARGLLPLIASLAREPRFGFTPPAVLTREDDIGVAVLVELRRRRVAARDAGHEPGTLLLLDNVSERELLSGAQLSTIPHDQDLFWLATTRLGTGDLRNRHGVNLLPLAELTPQEGLTLLRERQPDGRFPDKSYAAGCSALVDRLGGFTLAIEQTAILLGAAPEVSPWHLLNSLRQNGMPALDEIALDDGVTEEMRHQQRLLGAVLGTTLADLTNAERLAVTISALFGPDLVRWDWVRDLVTQFEPESAMPTPLHPDGLWPRIQRTLLSRRLLMPTDDPATARMHRLVREHVHAGASPAHVDAADTLLVELDRIRGGLSRGEQAALIEALEQRLLDLTPEVQHLKTSKQFDRWLKKVTALPVIQVLDQELTSVTLLGAGIHRCILAGEDASATRLAKALLERSHGLLRTERDVLTEYKTYRYQHGINLRELRAAATAATLFLRAAIRDRCEHEARRALRIIAGLPYWCDPEEVTPILVAFKEMWPAIPELVAEQWLDATGCRRPSGSVSLSPGQLLDWQVRVVLPVLLHWADPALAERAYELAGMADLSGVTSEKDLQAVGRSLGVYRRDSLFPDNEQWTLPNPRGDDWLLPGTTVDFDPFRRRSDQDVEELAALGIDPFRRRSDQDDEVLAALGDIRDPRLGALGKLGVGSDWAATAWLLAGPDLLGTDQEFKVGPWASLLGSVGETIRAVLVTGLVRHTDQGRSAEQQNALLLTDVVPSLQDALCQRMTGSRRLAR